MGQGYPMNSALRLLALIGLAGAVLAAPAAAALETRATPIALMAPRAGDTLAAGATAEIEWAPLARYADLKGVEEWEAFLSLDGGATYPLRITPHLDQDLRHFRWQVPPIPTADARLLLRFGDEHRETVVVLPQRFSIVPSPVAMVPAFLLEVPAPARGERARPDQDQDQDKDDDEGEEGVVAWVEGSRRGGSLRQMVTAAPPGFQTRIQPAETSDEAAVLAGGPPLSSPESRESLDARPAVLHGSPLGGPLDVRPFAFDILLLTQRQNE
jgi:hypothetical protein